MEFIQNWKAHLQNLEVRIGLGLCLVIATILAIYFLASELYPLAKLSILHYQIDKYLDAGDYREASSFLQVALGLDGTNRTTLWQINRFNNETNSPWRFAWWRKTLDLNEADQETALNLSKEAARWGDKELFEESARVFREEGGSEAQIANLQASLALSQKNWKEALQYLEKAYALAPGASHIGNNYAYLMISQYQPDYEEKILEVIRTFDQNPETHLDALRLKAALAQCQNKLDQTLKYRKTCHEHPKASLVDHCIYLMWFSRLYPREVKDEILNVWKILEEQPGERMNFIMWMMKLKRYEAALVLMDSLEPEQKNLSSYQYLRMRCLHQLKTYEPLLEVARDAKWEESDSIRSAYEIGSLIRLGRRGEAIKVLAQSTTQLASEVESLVSFLTVLKSMIELTEYGELIENHLLMNPDFAGRRKVTMVLLENLFAITAQSGDALRLKEVASEMSQQNPDNPTMKNNALYLDVLTSEDRRLDLLSLSLELTYKKNKGDPLIATTYGFALWKQGKFDKAYDIMSEIPRDHLERPTAAALCYSLVLEAKGKISEARQYAEMAGQAFLLNAEAQLLHELKVRLDRED